MTTPETPPDMPLMPMSGGRVADDDGLAARLDQLERTVAAQQQHIIDQDRRIAALDSETAPNPGASQPDLRPFLSPTKSLPDPTLPLNVDRRGMLKHVGVAAVGALGAGTAIALTQAQPAAAANGSNMVCGVFNAATNLTELAIGTGGNIAGKSAFAVTDGAVLTGEPDVFAISAIAEGNAMAGGLFASGLNTGIKSVASAIDGVGVHGVTTGPQSNSAGVKGTTASGAHGVWGVNTRAVPGGSGLAGISLNGFGAKAESINHSDLFLVPVGVAPPSRLDYHYRGELHVDSNGNLWSCATSGTPGSWRQLSGMDTAGSLHMLATPSRVYDSRPGQVPLGCVKGQFNNETRAIDAKFNGSGVPAGSIAVLANVTVTNTNPGGFVAVFKNGIAYPGTSTVNWGLSNSTVANSAVVAVDAAGFFACFCPVQTDVLVDVIGYYL